MELNQTQKMFIENDTIQWEEVGTGIRRKIMAFNASLMLVKVEFEKGSEGTLHSHYHSQITHIETGMFEVEIENKKQILKAGDAFYISSNKMHGVVCLEAGVLIDVFSPMREDFIHYSIIDKR